MKTTNLLLIALVAGGLAATPVMARSTAGRQTTASIGSYHGGHHGHHHHHSHSNVFFGLGLGYPYFGYGYPYGYYPYGYGYYNTPRTVYYAENLTDDATVAAVQRRLSNAGYYHGAIDGVIGDGTRTAIRAFERRHGLAVDGRIDRQLLATMGIA